MKIEKISENQIKLTLTKNDLKDNNIKIEELVKPSDKVQELFRNLMEKAFSECGFEVDNTPLMVEATPISIDGLIIIVTKLPENDAGNGAMSLISQNRDLRRYKKKGISHLESTHLSEDNIMIYSFICLDDVINASMRISKMFSGYSELFGYEKRYFLLLQSDVEHQKNDENIESALNEYGTKYASNVLSKYFLVEHGETIVHNPAVKILAENFS